jgi:hypothetical protein
MSLQLAAQHLSRQGRGGDSTLVHMSPREVKSLSDLAMAHGGQLSINPQTGLPEAGFLSSILPMVAGFALNAAVPGLGEAMGGFAIPALVGGGTALMTGSLGKGLMAGLGAYGGANLGQALASQGVEQATAAQLAQDQAYQTAQAEAVKNATAFGQTNPYLGAEFTGGRTAAEEYAKQAAATTEPLRQAQAAALEAQTAKYGALDLPGKLSQNFSTLTSPGGVSGLFDKVTSSPMSLLKTVGSAAAPAIGEAMTPKQQEAQKGDADMGQRYGFSMNPTQQTQGGQNPPGTPQTTTPFPASQFDSSEKRYFTPSYTKLTPEQAKELYGYAEGGTAQANPQPATQPIPMPQFTNAGKQPSDEPPALQMFKQMQAQRANQSQAPKAPQYNPAMGGAIFADGPDPTTVEGLYGTYLNRAPDKGGLDFWNKHFGSDIDAGEAALFRSSAAPEIAGKLLPVPTTVEGLYNTYLGRTSEKGGSDFWNKLFGPTVEADEANHFRLATLPELAANRKLAESTGGSLAHEYGQYLRQTRGEPNQPQAPIAPTTTDSSSELIYNPTTQKYNKNPNFVDAAAVAASDDPLSPENLAGNFLANHPGVPYSQVDPKTGIWTKYDRYGNKTNADGGLTAAYAGGGMTEADRMATASSYIGGNTSYPQALARVNQFSTPAQMPTGDEVVSKGSARIDLSTGEERLAGGGISHLGDYSDGGRLLRGPGDGVSDSIPAMIGKRQPARLADGEFVVPARIVSELGNGSTEAGARKLYAMMDRIQSARGKTVGKGKVAKNSRSEKYLPA